MGRESFGSIEHSANSIDLPESRKILQKSVMDLVNGASSLNEILKKINPIMEQLKENDALNQGRVSVITGTLKFEASRLQKEGRGEDLMFTGKEFFTNELLKLQALTEEILGIK